MRLVPFAEILGLERECQVARRLEGEPKVLIHPDGRVVKLVRARRSLRISRLGLPARRFVARLHAQGVFFAGGHPDNYIVQPDGEFGLIDIQDAWVLPFVLPTVLRALAFRILLKYPEDRAALSIDGRLGAFVESYVSAARLGPIRRAVFMAVLRQQVPHAYQQL